MSVLGLRLTHHLIGPYWVGHRRAPDVHEPAERKDEEDGHTQQVVELGQPSDPGQGAGSMGHLDSVRPPGHESLHQRASERKC